MAAGRARNPNRYSRIIERIFLSHYTPGATQVDFDREEFAHTAVDLNISPPKNLGDIIYSFRYRVPLPDTVQATAPEGTEWIIRPAGSGRYRFVAVSLSAIMPTARLAETKVPDATPGVIAMYALSDEQALLARVRYNRLIDIFTGVACYSLQSHLRSQVPGLGQVETDEVYIGIDGRGVHYVLPVQAKGGKDKLSIVQIEQDFALCEVRFPSLVCRPIAAQFMRADLIALFAFELTNGEVNVTAEKHYRLVPPSEMTDEDLAAYRLRPG
jgi:hypothetical protein